MFQRWFRYAGREGQGLWCQGRIVVPSYASWRHRARKTEFGMKTQWQRGSRDWDGRAGGDARSSWDRPSTQYRRGRSESWTQGDHTVPNRWKARKTEDREFILFPEGTQYMSRVFVLLDMVKREYEEEIYRGDKEQTLVWRMDYKSVSTRRLVPEKCEK